jgi:hypothetical protein
MMDHVQTAKHSAHRYQKHFTHSAGEKCGIVFPHRFSAAFLAISARRVGSMSATENRPPGGNHGSGLAGGMDWPAPVQYFRHVGG